MNVEDIFHPYSDIDFEEHALALFQHQYEKNEVYREFCNMLKINVKEIVSVFKIPFLPISFFKTHQVKTGNFEAEVVFRSSGTSGNETSKHFVKNAALYEHTFLNSFEHFYGNPRNYCFLALLPNYLEQSVCSAEAEPQSSLIYMMNRFISGSKYAESGYYLYNHEELFEKLTFLKEKKVKTVLFGVSFALMDFAEKYTVSFPDLMVFETGGMKGRRTEIVKEELHLNLCNAFGVRKIHSEYGMCELLSQAYSNGDNLFASPQWMKLLLRDEKDPLHCDETLVTGAINVIDFANLHSCAFIATDDLGKRNPNGLIEILGRLDAAQVKGCNLIYWG